jgi:predicted dehydrogenase
VDDRTIDRRPETPPMDIDQIRWGIVGPGRIAAKLAGDLAIVGGGTLHAVGSRSLERARAFADAHGAVAAYGSYGDLLDDPDVDAVYIATPHRQHHALAMAAIDRRKHLLVEKAFTCTLAGTVEIVEAARAAGTFCMEAMWTRFHPAMARMRELVADGAVGEVRAVRADLGMHNAVDPTSRLWDPAQGGGALLDLGVYPVSFVQSVLGGAPRSTVTAGRLGPTGVDVEAAVLWRGDLARTGWAQCSLASPLSRTAGVFGTAGWIEVPAPFHRPGTLRVYPVDDDGRTDGFDTVEAPSTGAGYSHEIDEVHRCLAAGLTESPVMPLDDTIAVMAVLDGALRDLGVHFDEADVPL